MKYRQIKDRKHSLGAGLLLKECLKEYGINIEEIRYGEHGKPEVDGIYFNISHISEFFNNVHYILFLSDKLEIKGSAEVKK